MKVDPYTNLLEFSVVCPLQADQLAYELKNHPNQPMVSKLLKGIRKDSRLVMMAQKYPGKVPTLSQQGNIQR